MNFKLFRATHQKSYDTTLKETMMDDNTFLKELKKAIKNNTLDAFIVNIFDNYPFPSAQTSFETFFDSCRTTEFEGTFFTVCDAICRNISHLDEKVAISFVCMFTKKYYEQQIYNTAEAINDSFLNYLMNHLPVTLLEEAVLVNFDNVMNELFIDDVKYIGTYNSWRLEIPKYFRKLMELFVDENFKSYVNFTSIYPELTPAVYEYVLEAMLDKSEDPVNIIFDDDFDLIDDFLRPMSDLEKYQGYYFASVRKYAKEILDYADNYAIMYAAGDFLIENFGISPELVNEFIDDETDDFVRYINESHSISDMQSFLNETLDDFCSCSRAYNRFMDNLPSLLMTCGIMLYAVLLVHFGPIYELTTSEWLCREYFPQEEVKEEKAEISIGSSDDLTL